MSGSPKYTTVNFEAARQAQLEAARQLREQERQRRQEEQRQLRIQAGIRAAQLRLTRVDGRIAALREQSAGLPQLAEVTELATRAGTLSVAARGALDEGRISRLNKDLRDVERRTDKLTTAVARELTLREHGGAVDLIVAQLDSVSTRESLDPGGYRSVTELVAQARERIGDTRRFPAAYDKLSETATQHLDRARDRQALLLRLATESDEVTARLTAVLDDAEAAGIAIPDVGRVKAAISDLRGEADGQHTARWEQRIAGLRRSTEEVTAHVDARLDQLERMTIIVEAASAALPASGLRVVPGSLQEQDGSVTFLAARTDGTPITLTVYAGDGRGTRLEYDTGGGDTVVETSVDGEIRRCDLTEQLLERFHTELDRQGVRTDGLHWAGKPERPRPPAGTALEVAPAQQRSHG
jgi:hypothetical protein